MDLAAAPDVHLVGGQVEHALAEALGAAVAGADLDVVGLAVFGPRNAVDKTVKGAELHP